MTMTSPGVDIVSRDLEDDVLLRPFCAGWVCPAVHGYLAVTAVAGFGGFVVHDAWNQMDHNFLVKDKCSCLFIPFGNGLDELHVKDDRMEAGAPDALRLTLSRDSRAMQCVCNATSNT
jgi:hypothetical protein